MDRTTKTPRIVDNGDGSYSLNAPAALRCIYETDLAEIKPEGRDRIRRFQRKVDAYMTAQEAITGRRPDVADALAGVVDLRAMTAVMRRDPGAAIDWVLDAGAVQ